MNAVWVALGAAAYLYLASAFGKFLAGRITGAGFLGRLLAVGCSGYALTRYSVSTVLVVNGIGWALAILTADWVKRDRQVRL